MARTIILLATTAIFFASGSCVSSVAAENLKSSSSVVRRGDNSGRQLAMATPLPKEAKTKNSKKDESVEAALGSARESLLGQLETHKVSLPIPKIDIPDNMEKTADACYKVVRSSITFAHEHTAQFSGWIARYFKQLSGPPKMTPMGGYETGHHIVPATFGQNSSKLYLTNEGRLKTVIVR